MFGVQEAYGILTTYSSWRFFKWEMMPEDEELASRLEDLHVSESAEKEGKDRSLETPQKGPNASQALPKPPSPPMSPRPYTEAENLEEEEEEEIEESEADQNREIPLQGILRASDVVTVGAKALRMLAWVLNEMQMSPVYKVPAHERDFLYVVEKDAGGGYEKVRHTLGHYKGRMPNSGSKKLYVLEELGHRFHGRVFRMMSKNGNLCVLKYFVKSQYALNNNGKRVEVSAEAAAKKSAEYWNKVYKSYLPLAFTGKWGGGDAVIMPDLEKITLFVGRKIVIPKLKETMLERFFRRGIWHGDPAWRNVAIVRDKRGVVSKACMIDLEPEKMIENVETSKWGDFDRMWAKFETALEQDWETYEAAEIASDCAQLSDWRRC